MLSLQQAHATTGETDVTKIFPDSIAGSDATPSLPGWIGFVSTAAVAGPAGFFTVMMILGLVTPGYNWVARYASELSLAPLGWIMVANFVLLGVVELGLATALGRTAGNWISGWVAAAAVGLIGAAFVVAGVCVTDPAKLVSGAHTWHGIVHAFMAVVIFFIATPLAGLATAVRFRGRRRFSLYCATTAIATPLLLIASFVSGGLIGLAERIVIAVVLAWLTILAIQVHRSDPARLDRPAAWTQR